MLQKYYGCHGSGDTLTGEVPQQARYSTRSDTSPGEGARTYTLIIYILRAWASWKLELAAASIYIARICELGAGKHLTSYKTYDIIKISEEDKNMVLIGGGCILGGLIASALFGNFYSLLIMGAIGCCCFGFARVKEIREEEKENEWRKNYPSYKY